MDERCVRSGTSFLERLCLLVPKKREHTVLSRGVLAGHGKLRASVVPTEEGIQRPKNTASTSTYSPARAGRG